MDNKRVNDEQRIKKASRTVAARFFQKLSTCFHRHVVELSTLIIQPSFYGDLF